MIENLPLHVYIFAGILGLLTLDFLIRFIFSAIRVQIEISRVLSQLKNQKDNTNLSQVFENTRIMKPLWREYEDSLHEQIEVDPQTGEETKIKRSTVPAEAIFRTDTIVDTPLRADFFRHLPGIFTGIGIIGTFSGLLSGLQAFQVSENPLIVRNSLSNLLHGVSLAFVVSALAITLAMVITFLEKRIISRLHARVELLTQRLDEFFNAGVGEEYLARLVKASEYAAKQAQPLQDALVSELKNALNQQSQNQITAMSLLGQQITSSIESSLKAPLQEIAQAVKHVSTEQGTAVHSMLQDLLERFNLNLRELLGDQITTIHASQKQALISLQETLSKIENISFSIESAGEKSASSMAQQLTAAMASAEARQQIMNDKMSEFIGHLSTELSRSHDASQERLQHTFDDIANYMAALTNRLNDRIQTTMDIGQKYQEQLTEKGQFVVSEFGQSVDLVTASVINAADEMKNAISAMREITSSTVSRMNAGADILYAASTSFAQNSQNINQTLSQTYTLLNEVNQVSQTFSNMSDELKQVLHEYQSSRDAMTSFLDALKLTVEQTRHETSVTKDVVSIIEKATEKLVTAQKEADHYLDRISSVIEDAHHSFTSNMAQAVDTANQDFQKSLSSSVSLLRIGIQELATTLEELATFKHTPPPTKK